MSPPLFLNFYHIPFFYSFIFVWSCMLHYALCLNNTHLLTCKTEYQIRENERETNHNVIERITCFNNGDCQYSCSQSFKASYSRFCSRSFIRSRYDFTRLSFALSFTRSCYSRTFTFSRTQLDPGRTDGRVQTRMYNFGEYKRYRDIKRRHSR